MILALDKPKNPGDLDAGKSYTHCHVERIIYSSTAYQVQIDYDFGYLNPDKTYTVGAASPSGIAQVKGGSLDKFLTSQGKAGEPALVAAMRFCYQYLIDALSLSGTIDPELPADPPPQMPTTPATGGAS